MAFSNDISIMGFCSIFLNLYIFYCSVCKKFGLKKHWQALVLCKGITHSIQSCLLYVLAKFQGLKTNRTRVTSNFLRLFKTGNYFCGIVVCCVDVRHRRFKKPRYTRLWRLRETLRMCLILEWAKTVVRNWPFSGVELF